MMKKKLFFLLVLISTSVFSLEQSEFESVISKLQRCDGFSEACENFDWMKFSSDNNLNLVKATNLWESLEIIDDELHIKDCSELESDSYSRARYKLESIVKFEVSRPDTYYYYISNVHNYLSVLIDEGLTYDQRQSVSRVIDYCKFCLSLPENIQRELFFKLKEQHEKTPWLSWRNVAIAGLTAAVGVIIYYYFYNAEDRINDYNKQKATKVIIDCVKLKGQRSPDQLKSLAGVNGLVSHGVIVDNDGRFNIADEFVASYGNLGEGVGNFEYDSSSEDSEDDDGAGVGVGPVLNLNIANNVPVEPVGDNDDVYHVYYPGDAYYVNSELYSVVNPGKPSQRVLTVVRTGRRVNPRLFATKKFFIGGQEYSINDDGEVLTWREIRNPNITETIVNKAISEAETARSENYDISPEYLYNAAQRFLPDGKSMTEDIEKFQDDIDDENTYWDNETVANSGLNMWDFHQQPIEERLKYLSKKSEKGCHTVRFGTEDNMHKLYLKNPNVDGMGISERVGHGFSALGRDVRKVKKNLNYVTAKITNGKEDRSSWYWLLPAASLFGAPTIAGMSSPFLGRDKAASIAAAIPILIASLDLFCNPAFQSQLAVVHGARGTDLFVELAKTIIAGIDSSNWYFGGGSGTGSGSSNKVMELDARNHVGLALLSRAVVTEEKIPGISNKNAYERGIDFIESWDEYLVLLSCLFIPVYKYYKCWGGVMPEMKRYWGDIINMFSAIKSAVLFKRGKKILSDKTFFNSLIRRWEAFEFIDPVDVDDDFGFQDDTISYNDALNTANQIMHDRNLGYIPAIQTLYLILNENVNSLKRNTMYASYFISQNVGYNFKLIRSNTDAPDNLEEYAEVAAKNNYSGLIKSLG